MTASQRSTSLIMVILLLGGITQIDFKTPALTFESLESKTMEDTPVFNQVTWISEKNQDIWLMKQSHQGIKFSLDKWDELMIKVDKTQRPFKISYHQLLRGKEVEYKVSCYFCHSNGPRAIRPNENSISAPLTNLQKLTLNLMNVRIKTYGKTEIKTDSFKLNDKPRVTPLKYFGKNETAHLKVASCTMCHNDSWWGRGNLTRQNALPIAHLVAEGKMPPWPLKLSTQEKKDIEMFIKGF